MGSPDPVSALHVMGPLEFGGVETQVLGWLRELPAHGVSNSVLVWGKSIGSRVEEFSRVLGAAPRFVRSRRPTLEIPFLAAEIARHSPTVVVSHSFGRHLEVGIASGLARIPLHLVVVHGDPRTAPLRNLIRSHLARAFCDGAIACSTHVLQSLSSMRLPPNRTSLLPNSVAVEEIASRANAVRQTRREDTHLTIAVVGRLEAAKDHDTLLYATKLLLTQGIAARLLIIGDGPRRSILTKACTRLGLTQHTDFLGQRSDVPELLGNADCLVLPTHTEGLPVVVLEGFSAGVPIVATDIPPVRSILADGRFGFLARPQDPSSLAQGIAQSRSAEASHKAEAAHHHVKLFHSFRGNAGKFARALRGSALSVDRTGGIDAL